MAPHRHRKPAVSSGSVSGSAQQCLRGFWPKRGSAHGASALTVEGGCGPGKGAVTGRLAGAARACQAWNVCPAGGFATRISRPPLRAGSRRGSTSEMGVGKAPFGWPVCATRVARCVESAGCLASKRGSAQRELGRRGCSPRDEPGAPRAQSDPRRRGASPPQCNGSLACRWAWCVGQRDRGTAHRQVGRRSSAAAACSIHRGPSAVHARCCNPATGRRWRVPGQGRRRGPRPRRERPAARPAAAGARAAGAACVRGACLSVRPAAGGLLGARCSWGAPGGINGRLAKRRKRCQRASKPFVAALGLAPGRRRLRRAGCP